MGNAGSFVDIENSKLSTLLFKMRQFLANGINIHVLQEKIQLISTKIQIIIMNLLLSVQQIYHAVILVKIINKLVMLSEDYHT